MMHSSKKNTSSTSWSSIWLDKKMRQASATLPWSSSLGGTTLRSIPAILIWLRCTVETCSYGIYRHAKRRWKNGARPLPLGMLPPSVAASTTRNGKSYLRQPATRETEEKSNSAMQKRQRSKKIAAASTTRKGKATRALRPRQPAPHETEKSYSAIKNHAKKAAKRKNMQPRESNLGLQH